MIKTDNVVLTWGKFLPKELLTTDSQWAIPLDEIQWSQQLSAAQIPHGPQPQFDISAPEHCNDTSLRSNFACNDGLLDNSCLQGVILCKETIGESHYLLSHVWGDPAVSTAEQLPGSDQSSAGQTGPDPTDYNAVTDEKD